MLEIRQKLTNLVGFFYYFCYKYIFMEYNTERDHLTIPEYGRHVHKMINHATSLTDKEIMRVFAQFWDSWDGTLSNNMDRL